MKLHQLPNGLMVSALTAAILVAGAAGTVTARDRDGHKGREARIERHDRPNNHTVNRRVQQRGPAYRNRVTVRAKSHRIIHALPSGYRTIHTPGHRYYYHHGVFYSRHPHGYEIVTAPRFYHLPPHARRIVVNRAVYYVCDDVYYSWHDGYYVICETPRIHSSIIFGAGPLRIVLTDD